MSNTKKYFEIHSHSYDIRPLDSYSHVVNEVKKNLTGERNINILDIGCGNGNFIKALIEQGVKGKYFATDISHGMAKMGSENLVGSGVNFFVADSFLIPIKSNVKFNVIHIASVLHHLIESTRSQSKKLIMNMINLLVSMLTVGGVLIVEDLYYNSYLIPQLTTNLIFYALRLVKLLNLDVRKFSTQLKPGLEVNFLHEKELSEILRLHGTVHLLHKDPWRVPKSYRVLLLKEFGHLEFILKKEC